MKSKLARLLSAVLALCMVCALPVAGAEATEGGILAQFQSPGVDAKPMFRAWFDNADYSDEVLETEMNDLYAKGFGGIEIADITNAVYEDETYYWGRSGWTEMMKKILRIADALPGDFKVDMTISPYWPVATDDITPNDEAASTELVFAWSKIAASEGEVDLPMPEIDLIADGATAQIPFIHTNRFEAATVAQVKEIAEDGSVVLDDATMRDVSDLVQQKDETTPAGIPDMRDPEVQALYAGTENLFEGFFGDRATMQDVQHYYSIDLAALGLADYAASEGEALAPGDYVLFGFYRKGTGETHNKHYDDMAAFGIHVFNSTPDGCVVINEFNKAGADAITGYWEAHVLDDELRALMQARGGDLFEDSLEAVSVYPFWSDEVRADFAAQNGYDITPYLPIVADEKGCELRFSSSEGADGAIWNDYLAVLGESYATDHIQRIADWSKATLNHGFRVQAYGNDAIDSGLLASQLDVAEGETLGFNGFANNLNRFRQLAAGVHFAGKKYVSDESMAQMMQAYQLSWKDYVRYFNEDSAAGANRAILHGYVFYKRDPSGANIQWPGTFTMGTMFSETFGPRQTYWENVQSLSGYMARMQSVLQGGKPAVDLAVYEADTFTGESPEIAALLNEGYSYDILSNGLMCAEALTVTDGRLTAGDVAYDALVVYDVAEMPLAVAEKLEAIAQAGLPVIFYMQTPGTVEPSLVEGSGTDADVQAIVSAMLALDNVCEATDDAALLGALASANALPDAQVKGLKTLHREDADGTDYYYLLNDTPETVSAIAMLEGEGATGLLNCWTGEVEPAAAAQTDEGRVAVTLNLAPFEGAIVAIGENVPVEAVESEPATGALKAIPLGNWTISLDSWGPYPVEETVNFNDAKVTTLVFEDQPLVAWSELPASAEQIAELGVESMSDVSGIATYTTSFTLPEDWVEGSEALLRFEHGEDQVLRVTVNGTAIENVNAMSDALDIGAYLVNGENTLEIRLSSTIVNRFMYENFHNGNNYAMSFAGGPAPNAPHGLTNVTLG